MEEIGGAVPAPVSHLQAIPSRLNNYNFNYAWESAGIQLNCILIATNHLDFQVNSCSSNLQMVIA